jgi:hypothetical protein
MKLDSYLAEKVLQLELARARERAARQSKPQPTPERNHKGRGRPRADGARECARQMHDAGLSWPAIAKRLNKALGKTLDSEAYRRLAAKPAKPSLPE